VDHAGYEAGGSEDPFGDGCVRVEGLLGYEGEALSYQACG
jgi:hypothetical protein